MNLHGTYSNQSTPCKSSGPTPFSTQMARGLEAPPPARGARWPWPWPVIKRPPAPRGNVLVTTNQPVASGMFGNNNSLTRMNNAGVRVHVPVSIVGNRCGWLHVWSGRAVLAAVHLLSHMVARCDQKCPCVSHEFTVAQ